MQKWEKFKSCPQKMPATFQKRHHFQVKHAKIGSCPQKTRATLRHHFQVKDEKMGKFQKLPAKNSGNFKPPFSSRCKNGKISHASTDPFSSLSYSDSGAAFGTEEIPELAAEDDVA